MDKQTQKELLDIVKNNYNEIAGHYKETRKKQIWSKLAEILNSLKPRDKVLDVGCGSGRLLKALDGMNIDYVGLDNCAKFIEDLKKTGWQSNAGTYKFLTGDILHLGEIKDIDFDYVFAIAVLQHIPGRDLRIMALRQLKNKASQKGKIIVTVWNMWSKKWEKKRFKSLIFKFYLLKLIGKNKMDFGDILFDWKEASGKILSRRYYHAFRKRELKKLCKKAGLKIESISKDERNYYIILKK